MELQIQTLDITNDQHGSFDRLRVVQYLVFCKRRDDINTIQRAGPVCKMCVDQCGRRMQIPPNPREACRTGKCDGSLHRCRGSDVAVPRRQFCCITSFAPTSRPVFLLLLIRSYRWSSHQISVSPCLSWPRRSSWDGISLRGCVEVFPLLLSFGSFYFMFNFDITLAYLVSNV